jgi:hypothetical protein
MNNGYDGRRRPPTDGLPRTERMSPVEVRQNAAAKRMLRRLVQGENPPTAPMSIVDRLAGSPYANPMIQVGGVDASARKTIDFALHLAESMFRYGAGALEVETSIIAITAALGLKNIEVDITNQSVAINYAPKDQTPITLLRVVRSWTNNYAGLAKVHQLVTDIVSGGVGRERLCAGSTKSPTVPSHSRAGWLLWHSACSLPSSSVFSAATSEPLPSLLSPTSWSACWPGSWGGGARLTSSSPPRVPSWSPSSPCCYGVSAAW